MFKQLFWMRALLHPTPKRSILFSNSRWISLFSFASKMKWNKLRGEFQTTDKYVDKKGRKRFKGNKALKGTQTLAKIYIRLWYDLVFHSLFWCCQFKTPTKVKKCKKDKNIWCWLVRFPKGTFFWPKHEPNIQINCGLPNDIDWSWSFNSKHTAVWEHRYWTVHCIDLWIVSGHLVFHSLGAPALQGCTLGAMLATSCMPTIWQNERFGTASLRCSSKSLWKHVLVGPECYFKWCYSWDCEKHFETVMLYVADFHSRQVDQTSDVKDLYAQLPWADGWDDADLRDVIFYLRGSKLLTIPADWRPLLPSELWICNMIENSWKSTWLKTIEN